MKRLQLLYIASLLGICTAMISCASKKYSFDSNSFVIPYMENYLKYSIRNTWRFGEFDSKPYYFYPIKMIAIANKKNSEFGFYPYESTAYQYIKQLDTLDSSWYAFTIAKDSTSALPTNFRKFMPPFVDSIYLTSYIITDTIKKGTVNIDNEKVNLFRFPDTLNLLPSKLVEYYKNPIIEVEDISLTKPQKIGKGGNSLGRQLFFNPSLQPYEKSIVLLWGDYVSTYNAKPEIYAKRTLKASKYKRMFERYIMDNYKQNNYAMHKSYFELILWQLYNPKSFKVKDNFGKYRSFLFTSNNPDYPGNYEIKFNIYQPYYFKVFKR